MGLFDVFDQAFESIAEQSANYIEQETYSKKCVPLIKLQSCLEWAKKWQQKFPQSKGFLISVKKNPLPKNENDILIITLAMLDEQNQPVHYDSDKSVSTLKYGRTKSTI